MSYIREHNIAIITSIIASFIFLYILQPTLGYLGGIFVSVFSSISSKYESDIYRKIAHLEITDYAFMIFSLLVIILFLFTLWVLLAPIVEPLIYRTFPNLSDERPDDNGEDSQSLSERPDDNGEDSQSLSERSDDNTEKSRFLGRILEPLWAAITCIFCLLFLSTRIYQLMLITGFKRHMMIVAPYIDEQKEEEIFSSWALMDSRADYDSIYVILETIAADNSIELPANAIYSLAFF